MVTTELKALCEELASMSGWDIAKKLGIEYDGDSNPIEHGGVFFNTHNWEHDYADCVEFWIDPDSPKHYGCPDTLCVTIGTIHKANIESAYDCCGFDREDDTPEQITLREIVACRHYNGIEPNCYDNLRTYRLSEWKEWRIWKSVLPLLQSLK